MSFGLSGTLQGDIAGDHIDALPGYSPDGDAVQAEALQAAKDAVKLILSRTFKTGSVSVSVSGHVNTDGTGYASISISASQAVASVQVAPTPDAPSVPEAKIVEFPVQAVEAEPIAAAVAA